jgi:hypothetical protein
MEALRTPDDTGPLLRRVLDEVAGEATATPAAGSVAPPIADA